MGKEAGVTCGLSRSRVAVSVGEEGPGARAGAELLRTLGPPLHENLPAPDAAQPLRQAPQPQSGLRATRTVLKTIIQGGFGFAGKLGKGAGFP